MIPDPALYQIRKDGHMFYVVSKCDLMHQGEWHRCTPNYDTEHEAHYFLHKQFIKDQAECERLKKLGRTFPDNE
jgi:hypothetical protein